MLTTLESTAATTASKLYGNRDVVRRMFVMKEHDYTTATHSVNLMAMSLAYCAHVGADADFSYQMCLAGLLHDIGKTRVDPAILTAARKLTPDEFGQIQQHPSLGSLLLADGFSPSPVVLNVVSQHHEKLDGSGYPQGLAGDAIAAESQIVSVLDCYEALTTDERSYRQGIDSYEALTIIKSEVDAGKFDDSVFNNLVRMLRR